jgi:TetR/AcrR family transcriptional regulator, transcriptional repressor for nem operon
MRYKKDHHKRSHAHIVDAASRRFREDGIAAAGLARVMQDAGLTKGAFYAHFSSKDALVQEGLMAALDTQRNHAAQALSDGAPIEEVIRAYLSPTHRDIPSNGCPTSALVSEIARQPRKLRMAYTKRLTEFLELLTDHLPSDNPELSRKRATGLFATMIGTLQLSRAVSDKALSDQILQDGIEMALRALDRQ